MRVRPVDAIGESLKRLSVEAATAPDRTFYLTRVGQGLAGLDEQAIRAQVEAAQMPGNVRPWWDWEAAPSASASASPSTPFRLVVAGGRDFADPAFLDQALNRAMADYAPADVLSGLSDTSPYGRLQVISGGAAGADTLGEQWAKAAGVPVQRYPAAWDNLDAPGAVIRTNRRGQKYNANAGFDRNQQMAENADAVLVMPGGRGTDHMVRIAQELGLPVWDARSGDLDSLKLLPGAAQAMQEVARPTPAAAPAAAPVSPPATEQLSFFDEARRFAGQAWPWMAAAGGSAALALAVAELQSVTPGPPPYPPS